MKRNFTLIIIACFMLIRSSSFASVHCYKVDNYYLPEYCYSIDENGMLQIELPVVDMQLASDQEIAQQFLQVIHAANQYQSRSKQALYINWADYFSNMEVVFIDMVACVLPNGNSTTLTLDFTPCTENSLMQVSDLTTYKSSNLERYTIAWPSTETGQLYLVFGHEESLKAFYLHPETEFAVAIH
ncbi:MAG TPA: hypothetical protein PKA00_11370 [Saprospiraceae bacterium]|nr:hypothetical protein [Saprospiraceae bacterium]HMQ83502.1 hypothetical protein [Saprospiraceae bacterium]